MLSRTWLRFAWPSLLVFASCTGWLAAAGAADGDRKIDPLDWTYWRGPEQNGISRETGLPDKWDPKGGDGSNLAWKRDDLGGRSTPVVMNGQGVIGLMPRFGMDVVLAHPKAIS